MRRRRGFVQMAILHLLKEQAMHGYQIMKGLEERSDSAYSASAGTVYPALQELVDQQLIEVDTSSDKKIYTINENGNKRIEETSRHKTNDFWSEWKERMTWRNSKESIKLKESLDEWESTFHQAIKQTRKNPNQAEALISLLNECTDKLKEFNLREERI